MTGPLPPYACQEETGAEEHFQLLQEEKKRDIRRRTGRPQFFLL